MKAIKVIHRLVLVFFLEVIVLCLIASSRLINIESTIMLLIFNFLFVSLTFHLNGSLSRKLSILAIGNVIGLFWNCLFCFFAATSVIYFGKTFDAFYTILNPLLNLIWIVSFWSLSLAALPNLQNMNAEAESQ